MKTNNNDKAAPVAAAVVQGDALAEIDAMAAQQFYAVEDVEALLAQRAGSGEPYGWIVKMNDGHETYFREEPTGFRSESWKGLAEVLELFTAPPSPVQALTERQIEIIRKGLVLVENQTADDEEYATAQRLQHFLAAAGVKEEN